MNEPRYCRVRRHWCRCDYRCEPEVRAVSLDEMEARIRAAEKWMAEEAEREAKDVDDRIARAAGKDAP